MDNETLLLKWGEFDDNIRSSYQSLQKSCEFTDVTLAFEDGRQFKAHRLILASSSAVFTNILQSNTHPHPLIYMRGINLNIFMDLINFIYNGEVIIHNEKLDDFLAIGQEFKCKGLFGQNETKSYFPEPGSEESSSKDRLDEKGQDPPAINLEKIGFRVLADVSKVQDYKREFHGIMSEWAKEANTSEEKVLPHEAQLETQVSRDPYLNIQPQSAPKFEIHKIYATEPTQDCYECAVCGNELRSRSLFKLHLRSHDSFDCSICGKKKTSIEALEKHKSYHERSVQIEYGNCNICKKRLRTNLLSKHEAKHTKLNGVPLSGKFDYKTGFEDLDEKIKQFIKKVDGVWTCKECEGNLAQIKPILQTMLNCIIWN